MATEFFAFEMLTGQRLTPLPVDSGDWRIGVNADDSTSCTIKADSVDAKLTYAWEASQLARNGLLVVVDNVPVAAGPIWKRSFSNGEISLTGGGLRSYWDRRVLLPVAARSQPLVNPDGSPNTGLDTNLSGLSYGTIAKRYIQLARLWPGGAIPMQLPADELGSYERNVAGIELKKLRGLIDNLTKVENGPDIEFRPRWNVEGSSIYWEMRHGSVSHPRLGNDDPSLISWSTGGESGAFDLSIDEDATGMAEEVFAVGGRSADRVIASSARSTKLYDDGYPLLQGVDTSHSSVSEQTTMDGYAAEGARLGGFSASMWSMSVRSNEGLPLGDYWIGDTARIDVADHMVLADGAYTRRIAQISGDAEGDSFQIVFAEALA